MRPKWITRSLSEVYFSLYRRKRLETSSTRTAEVMASQLLGEVALEAAEHRERKEEQDGGAHDHDAELRRVPHHPGVGREDGDRRAVAGERLGLVVDGALEREDDRRDR